MEEYKLDSSADTFIGGWFIDHSICDRIVEEFNSNPQLHMEDDSGNRNYTLLSGDHLTPKLSDEYNIALKDVLKKYSKKYERAFNFVTPWALSRPFNIQKYEPGDYYSAWHAETPGPISGKYLRHLAFMTYLNDCDGGTRFMYQNIVTKPQKGLTLIWPAGWTHMHRGVPATVDKYIATGWTIHTYKIK